MKVCLATVHVDEAFSPLALLYLRAQLVQERVLPLGSVDILEFSSNVTPVEVATRVLESLPDVVGFSCYVWNIRTLLAACRLIKGMRPSARIVLGGPEVGPVARQILELNPAIDCVVLSEGEIPFAEIVSAWGAGDDIAGVKGICVRQREELIDTGAAPVVRPLDRIASPYQFGDFHGRGRIICIETQRGCVFRCNFCFYNKDLSIRNRRFADDRVKDELRHWLQQDVTQIYLMDPIFNLHAERAKELCRFIAAHNHRRIPLHTEIWAEFVDAEMADLMRQGNFQFLEVGLQTTDQAVLATVERRLKLSRFRAGIEHLKRAELRFEVQLIFGLPGETRATFRSSLNFAASLQPPRLAVFPLLVLTGTELRRKAAILGIDYDPEPPNMVRSHGTMSVADVEYGRSLATAIQRIGNRWTVRLLARERGVTFADLIDDWLSWTREHHVEDRAQEWDVLRSFVMNFCALRGIPSAFYERSLALEFDPDAAGAARAEQAVAL